MKTFSHHKYIIVGAGISALQSALIFAEEDIDFVILEASNTLGGRIRTHTL